MTDRFTPAHVSQWRDTGFVCIEDFFTPTEIQPVVADYDLMYAQRRQSDGQPVSHKPANVIGTTHQRQFMHFDQLPYDASPAVNLISLHPQLIRFAQTLLGVPQVHCYQSHTWAKFTGEADYDQPFHCDFGNHTLTVPSDDIALRTVDFIIYLTDVSDDLGALHYLTRQDVEAVVGDQPLTVEAEQQTALQAVERSAAGPAGTLVAHGIDTLHRGTNLTCPHGHRYTMTAGYKAAGNDMIGFHVWQFAPQRPWHRVINHATPEQLQVLGIPPPGDGFWTRRTLSRTRQRWPDWDMQPYFDAAGETLG